MKINLNELKKLYKYIKNNNLSYKINIKNEDFEENDLILYVFNTMIDNLEYDFGIDIYDYIDFDKLIEYE